MTTIKINNAEFYAYHGVLEYEKVHGNKFQVDIEMQCDLSSLKDDSLGETVDYLAVYNAVKAVFTERKYNLIETVINKIGEEILERFLKVHSVKVSIRKPNAPLGLIESVEITQTFARK
jgi:dihydroneopterin aldolase